MYVCYVTSATFADKDGTTQALAVLRRNQRVCDLDDRSAPINSRCRELCGTFAAYVMLMLV